MVQSEKMSQKLGEGDFMRGMKLVALRQNGKELAQMTEFFKTGILIYNSICIYIPREIILV